MMVKTNQQIDFKVDIFVVVLVIKMSCVTNFLAFQKIKNIIFFSLFQSSNNLFKKKRKKVDNLLLNLNRENTKKFSVFVFK